jgi:hypothetical protein
MEPGAGGVISVFPGLISVSETTCKLSFPSSFPIGRQEESVGGGERMNQDHGNKKQLAHLVMQRKAVEAFRGLMSEGEYEDVVRDLDRQIDKMKAEL